jgi:hypothetical protein
LQQLLLLLLLLLFSPLVLGLSCWLGILSRPAAAGVIASACAGCFSQADQRCCSGVRLQLLCFEERQALLPCALVPWAPWALLLQKQHLLLLQKNQGQVHCQL